MKGTEIGDRTKVDKAILAENVVIGCDCELGVGEEAPNTWKPDIYNSGLVTIGENSVIPSHVQIGKNTAISGVTVAADYVDGVLESGETLIKAGEQA